MDPSKQLGIPVRERACPPRNCNTEMNVVLYCLNSQWTRHPSLTAEILHNLVGTWQPILEYVPQESRSEWPQLFTECKSRTLRR